MAAMSVNWAQADALVSASGYIVLQDHNLLEDRTVFDNVALPCALPICRQRTQRAAYGCFIDGRFEREGSPLSEAPVYW